MDICSTHEVLETKIKSPYLNGNAGDNNSNSKKAAMGRGSIATWLVNIFHGNTIRPSDTSSTRVGIMQSGVRGMAGFGEIPSAPERESIV